MEQLVNYKHKIDFLISDNTHSIQSAQESKCRREIYKKCNECNRRTIDKGHQICHLCYNIKTILKPEQSGNKVIDDFIRYTQVDKETSNCSTDTRGGELEFVPYDQFKKIEFIAEGGFSKIYKAIWVDGPVDWDSFKRKGNIIRKSNYTVVLKKLNNSKNITSKELNELKIFYEISSDSYYGEWFFSEYFGITQEPNTKDIMIIMHYYKAGDLVRYLSNDFYNISWTTKLGILWDVVFSLMVIHGSTIIHKDLHSGNILTDGEVAVICDFGISKSAIEYTDDDNNETYGIIPYMAPELFQGQKYTKASDIYSFGMIMWEFMTGRRPFWDEIHDIELIIKICDGLRPPIVTNAPEGYIELMKECWNSDPEERPTDYDVFNKINGMRWGNSDNNNPTKIIKSSNIGPVTTNNSGAIYKSRPLTGMIQSAMSLRSLRSQTIDPFYYYQKNSIYIDKRKFDDDSIEDSNNDQSIKRRRLIENKNSNDYITKEIELDINNIKLNKPQNNNEYITKEFDMDINNLS